MTLTVQDRRHFEVREALPERERVAVESAFHAVIDALRVHGLKPAMDDRAAALEGALARYVVESRLSEEYQ